jgi:hypothetical protein
MSSISATSISGLRGGDDDTDIGVGAVICIVVSETEGSCEVVSSSWEGSSSCCGSVRVPGAGDRWSVVGPVVNGTVGDLVLMVTLLDDR